MAHPLLGDLTPERFLEEYWQKKPLLIRQAVTRFDWLPDLAALTDLAAREDVESRLVTCREGVWRCERGPFRAARFKRLGPSDWTVLIQNVNHFVPFADALLARLDFIPRVRLDDLMISWAPPGGSVGPHFDNYDVFLLQVGGRKRWQISAQEDLTLVEGAPLKILQRFAPEAEWVLEHGDMLYLPPCLAHHGVALEAGMTWSLGFRAPTTQEVAVAFLDFLRDRLQLDGRYADPDLRPTRHPGALPDDFVARIAGMLSEIRWDEALVREFTGRYFSEPKPHVYFDEPDEPVEDFAAQLCAKGCRLDPKSTLLYDATACYLNGELLAVSPALCPFLHTLADTRSLPPGDYPAELVRLLEDAYCWGQLQLGADADLC